MQDEEINLITPDSSREYLEAALIERQAKLLAMKADIALQERADLQLETANIMLELAKSGMPEAVTALGNGLWLAITYPIDAEVSLLMLNNLIEDMPDKSDGASVAAATTHYIADLRLDGEKRDSVMFLTTNLLSKVAARHSNVSDQGQLNFWMDKLELNNPAVFLPRMSQVLEALLDGNWWYDKDCFELELPVN